MRIISLNQLVVSWDITFTTKALKCVKEMIEHSIDDAIRNGEEIEDDVQNWLSKARTICSEAEKLLPRDHDGRRNTRCSSVCFSNLILRYQDS